MHSSYDPQHPLVNNTATPSPPSQAPMTPQRPGRFLVLRTTIRLLVLRFLYNLTILFRKLRPHAISASIITFLLILVAFMAVKLWWPTTPVEDVRVAALPPAPAVEAFLKGQQSYNADVMWDSFSLQYQAQRLQRGSDKSILQMQADEERRQGLRYGNPSYIGGKKLEDGSSLYFYTLELAFNTQRATMPYVFTAGPDGKITSIYSPFLNQSSNAQ